MIKLCVGNSPLKCIFNALYLEAQNKFIALLLVELLLLLLLFLGGGDLCELKKQGAQVGRLVADGAL